MKTHTVKQSIGTVALACVASLLIVAEKAVGAVAVLDSTAAANTGYIGGNVTTPAIVTISGFSGLDFTGADKLVVSVGSFTWPISAVEYAGQAMTEAVNSSIANKVRQSAIYYLDLGASPPTGDLKVTLYNGYGVGATAWVLGGTADGVGASGSSTGNSASLTTSNANGLVIAHATDDGTVGSGLNMPAAQSPLTTGPGTFIDYSSAYDSAIGTGYQIVPASGTDLTPTFDNGYTTVAAEFPPTPPGSLTLASSTYSASEANGVVTVSVSRVDGSTGAVGATLTATNLVSPEALAGSDFTAVVTNLTWADGDTSDRLVAIPITDDDTGESAEAFHVLLSDFSGAEVGSITSATVTIFDDDASNAAPVAVDDAASVDEDGSIVINVTTNDTDADSDPITVSSVDDPSNGTASIQSSTNVLYTPDADWNGTEVFDYVISDGQGGSDTGTVTVTVNSVPDPGVLSFSAASASSAETAGSVTLSVSRTGGAEGAVSVAAVTVSGTAAAGSDFTAVSNALNWADGDSASKDVAVPLLDDSLVEGPETFSLVLTNATGGATLIDPTNAVVTILGNDGVSVLDTASAFNAAWAPTSIAASSFGGFSLTGADKLVVTLLSRDGAIGTVTYNGRAMTNAISLRDASGVVQLDSSIWYQDHPGTTTGDLQFTGASRGVSATLWALGNTADGVGGSGSASDSSVSLTTTAENSLVVASSGLYGAGAVAPFPMPLLVEGPGAVYTYTAIVALGTGYQLCGAPEGVTSTFDSGDVSVATEFLFAPPFRRPRGSLFRFK